MGSTDYKISIQPDFVLVERPDNYKIHIKNMPAMLTELSAACAEAGCRKVLIVGPKTKIHLDTLDIFNLGEQIAGLRLQIAIVESHDASIDDENFLETVVFNRGGPLQFFMDEEEAKDWLKDS